LYIKYENENIVVIIVYVNDIIFGSDVDMLSQNLVVEMKDEFEMLMLGELSFFLGL